MNKSKMTLEIVAKTIKSSVLSVLKYPSKWDAGFILAASILASLMIFPSKSSAYPTLIRKGYATCATCHYNPSGGGALTSYGKYISQELFGTFNDSSNSLPFLVNPEYQVGTGDESIIVAQFMARAVQTHFDTPQVRRRQIRQMQMDLEGGIAHNGWQLLGTVGPRLDSAIEGKNTKKTTEWRRYWAGRVTQNYAVRIGKFMPEFGIYHPHHNIPTRKGLFFNHNEEPQIAQATWFGDSLDVTGAYLQGMSNTQLAKQKGYSSTVSYRNGASRIGLSKLDAKGDGLKSGAEGVFSQVGVTEKIYLLAEFDRKTKTNARKVETKEHVAYMEAGYEVFKAVSPYVATEYYRNLRSDLTIKTPNIGLQLHPLTHTEIVLQGGKSFIQTKEQNQTSVQGFAMLNVYF